MTNDRGRRRHLTSQRPTYQQPSNRLLLALLMTQGRRTGLTLKQLASRVGVSYSMVTKWGTGEALIARSSDEVLGAMGEFLGVPTALIRLLSGALTLDDFRWPGDQSIEQAMANQLIQPPGDRLPGQVDEAVVQHLRLLTMAAMLDGHWEHGGGYLKQTLRWMEQWPGIFLES